MLDMKPTLPQSSGNDVSSDQWGAWNEYYYNLLNVDEKPSTNGEGIVKQGYFNKTKNLVGIANVFVDCGLQEQKDSEYDSKEALPAEGEENSAEELAVMAKYPSNYYKWVEGKRKKVIPNKPTQEYCIMFDFPSVMVDWTKHPMENLHSLGKKPLRVSYNGFSFFGGVKGFSRRLPFDPDYKTKLLSTKTPLYKMAAAMGVEDVYTNSGYNLSTLGGKACKFDVVISRNTKDGKSYYNTDIRNMSKIVAIEAGEIQVSVEQQIPKCDIEPQAILLNLPEGKSYNEAALGSVKYDKGLRAVLPHMKSFKPSPEKFPDFVLGVDWNETGLSKVLDWGNTAPQQQPEKTSTPTDTNTSVESKPSEKVTEKPVTKVNPMEPPIDFEDDIPF